MTDIDSSHIKRVTVDHTSANSIDYSAIALKTRKNVQNVNLVSADQQQRRKDLMYMSHSVEKPMPSLQVTRQSLKTRS